MAFELSLFLSVFFACPWHFEPNGGVDLSGSLHRRLAHLGQLLDLICPFRFASLPERGDRLFERDDHYLRVPQLFSCHSQSIYSGRTARLNDAWEKRRSSFSAGARSYGFASVSRRPLSCGRDLCSGVPPWVAVEA